MSLPTAAAPTEVRLAHCLLDAEAIRVIKSAPKWTPAHHKGKVVRQRVTVPVSFVLAEGSGEVVAVVDDARFDVIFCRNVLGDMEPSRRARVLAGLEQRLVDDGCLFLGLDERIEDDTIAFRPVQGRRGVYVKSPASLRRAA